MSQESTPDDANQEYRVLARKYRPQSFDDLIGQDALVQTLKNAIDSGRVAHAFMLTGVRGVGKTTTARIIAKALNYTGENGDAGPTTGNTDDCAIAQAITQDRHPDVMEMDAASRTGVDDIREILDGVRYAPISARYKIYIIDEVHMLSKAAFNALLKTLEEPPAHVKFIFATTEIRKVPVTILSRCQRFDLARVGLDVLKAHFEKICGEENFTIEAQALDSIARSADGSVRDGLSLLDQAMALAADGVITDTAVAAMLGLGDRAITFNLLDAAFQADTQGVLQHLDALHNMGTDAMIIAEDLMAMCHALMVSVAVDGKGDIAAMAGATWPHSEDQRASTLAAQAGMPALNRAWQILLKGLQDMRHAPDMMQSLSITLLRLCYASSLPDPARLIETIQANGATLNAQSAQQSIQQSQGDHSTIMQGQHNQALAVAPAPAQAYQPNANPTDIQGIVHLCEERGALILAQEVRNYAHPVTLKPGRFEFSPAPDAPSHLAATLAKNLSEWTGQRWIVSVSKEGGKPTLAQCEAAQAKQLEEQVMQDPFIKQILTRFPDAQLKEIIPFKKGDE